MADHVVDTNVLLLASAHDAASPFADTHVPPEECLVVFNWLATFRADARRCMVLDIDEEHGIIAEYKKRKLGAQDFGYHVLLDKQSSARFVIVEYDHEGHAIVPEGLVDLDPSDRKMAAAVLADRDDGGASTIVNACDSDWYEHQEALEAHGVFVEQIIHAWAREQFECSHPEARRKKPRWAPPAKKQ